MRYTFLFVIATFVSFQVFSQDFDNRLLKSYSSTELQSASPSKLKMLVYAIDNATYLAELPTTKGNELDGSIAVENLENISFTDLNLKIIDRNQYFKVKGTSKMLVVKSSHVLLNELETNK